MKIDVPDFPRLADYAGVWAIEPQAGSALLERVKSIDLAAHVATSRASYQRTEFRTTQIGKSKIAVIPIAGSMMKAATSFGGASTVEIRRQIREAAGEESITSIAIMIDSPGGTVAGTADLAAEVAKANALKPVYAFIEDMGASAAYWVASQASKIFANDRTALVGSIGTLAVVYDYSKAADKAGIRTLVIGTGPNKGAGAPGAEVTAEQEAYYRGLVEDAQTSFDAAVSQGRGLSAKQLDAVKTGGVFGAMEAQRLGLIDGITSIDSFFKGLATASRPLVVAHVATERKSSMLFNDFVAGAGVDPKTMSTQQREYFTGIHRQLYPPAEQSATAAELAQWLDDTPLMQRAQTEGWSVTRAKQEAEAFMKVRLPNGVRAANPAFLGGDNDDHPGIPEGVRPIVAALLIRSGHSSAAEKLIGERALDQSRRLQSMSLVDLAAAALRQDGRHVPHDTQGMLRASLSGGSLTTALSGASDLILQSQWMHSKPTWGSWCAVRTAKNFRTHTSVRPTFGGDLTLLPRGGDVDHGVIGEDATIEWKIARYAKKYAVDEQDIIDDNLSIFQEIVPSFGIAALRTLADLIYRVLLSNANSFFSVGHGNLASGGGSVLQTSSLATAVKNMRLMTDPDGSAIDIVPKVLSVPPELEVTARALLQSAELSRSTQLDDITGGQPTGNPMQSLARLEVEPRLSSGVPKSGDLDAVAGSSTGWYLFAGPESVPFIVAGLNGSLTPRVETFGLNSDPDSYSVSFRVSMDVGAATGDYRAAQRSTGS